jgi:uncharacterized protein YggL (DUF469 family)
MAFPDINIGSKFDAKGFKQAQTATDKLNKSVKSLASTFGIAFGTTAVVAFAKASVKAFIQDDNAARSLGITLKNLGLETGNTSKYVNEMISNLEKQTGVLDDDLRPGMDRLLRATGSVSKATTLLGLALDISAGTGKDLTTVTQGLQKAYLGNNASLGRLGVGLSKAELTSSSFEEIQIRLSELFAGQASSAAESYAGQLNKLTIAGNNAKEVIGKGIIQALTESSGSFNNATGDIEQYAEAISDLIVDFGRFFRLSNAVPSIFELLTDPVSAIKNFDKVADEIDAQIARQNKLAMGKNPIQAGSYLITQKKITTLTKEQSKAQAKILADKRLTLAVDKANLALAKGTDVFDMDKIQLNAALIGQAEALGKATTGSQILAIANDVQRLKVKQDIAALEDAIASKDTVAIEKATAKLNADLNILGALQKQDAKLLDINRVLAGMKSTDLINLSNLQAALDLLAKFKFPTLTIPGVTTLGAATSNAGITFNPNQNKDRNYDQNVLGVGGDMPASLNVPMAGVDFNPNQNRDRNYTNNVINVNAGVIGDENIIVDAVQNALNEIARRGYTTTYAGAIAV